MFLIFLRLNPSKMMPLFNKVFSANVIAFTSDRTVDFTLHENQLKLNELQKKFLLSQLNLDLPEPVHIRQVHGDKIVIVDKDTLQRDRVLEEADGLLTKSPCLPLAIRSADCVPVFLFDEKKFGIGLIHVGWKGYQKNIVRQTIERMEKQWRSDPRDIKVHFGPSIRSCCYEIGNEFLEYFPNEVMSRDGRLYLDLIGMNQNQLVRLGVRKENISDCGICTCCDKNYFSHRREGESAGRMISLIMLNEAATYGAKRT